MFTQGQSISTSTYKPQRHKVKICGLLFPGQAQIHTSNLSARLRRCAGGNDVLEEDKNDFFSASTEFLWCLIKTNMTVPKLIPSVR